MSQAQRISTSTVLACAQGKIGVGLKNETGGDEALVKLMDAVRVFSASWGYKLEHQEVFNLLYERLNRRLASGKTFAEYVISAKNPHAYLKKCLFSWVREEQGFRTAAIEQTGADLLPEVKSPSDESLEWLRLLLFDLLAELVPGGFKAELSELISFSLHNPPQRKSYEWVDRQEAYLENKFFTEGQVAALMRVLWGSRKDPQNTSLVRAILRDPNFDPRRSPIFLSSLLSFKKSMSQKRNIF